MIVQLLDATVAEEGDTCFDYLLKGGGSAFSNWTKNKELEHKGKIPEWVGVFFVSRPCSTVVGVRSNVGL